MIGETAGFAVAAIGIAAALVLGVVLYARNIRSALSEAAVCQRLTGAADALSLPQGIWRARVDAEGAVDKGDHPLGPSLKGAVDEGGKPLLERMASRARTGGGFLRLASVERGRLRAATVFVTGEMRGDGLVVFGERLRPP